jgi:hypothetical protein
MNLNKLFTEDWWKSQLNIDEIKINRPPRKWDFTKYISNLDSKYIKLGDIIKTKFKEFKITKIEPFGNNGDVFYDSKDKIGYTFFQLERINDKNKKLFKPYLNEIKINNPNNLKLYIEPGYENQPYFLLKDGTKFFGYLGNNDFIEFQNVGEEFDELISYLDSKRIKYYIRDSENDENYVLINKEYLNIQKEINDLLI